MARRKPDLWALLLMALAFIACGGGTLAVVAWWVWRATR